jgi:hypothetical protein
VLGSSGFDFAVTFAYSKMKTLFFITGAFLPALLLGEPIELADEAMGSHAQGEVAASRGRYVAPPIGKVALNLLKSIQAPNPLIDNLNAIDRALLGPLPVGLKLNKDEIQIVVETNRLREKAGRPKVRVSRLLTLACQAHSRIMASKRSMYHSNISAGQSENVHQWQPDGKTAVWGEAPGFGWRDHPGHRENMYDPKWNWIGAGSAAVDSQGGRKFMCQQFK